ncbi:MAG: hypothetical protein R6X34_08960 [Chloroflexota bacterium]
MNHASRAPHQPRSVTLALLGVFFLGLWNFGRALALNQQMDLLIELAVRPDPRFRFIIALIWGVLFMGLWWLLRRKRPFTRRLIPLILVFYTLYELGLTAIFGQNHLLPQSIWFNLGFYTLLILWYFWALNRKTAVNSYFNQSAA